MRFSSILSLVFLCLPASWLWGQSELGGATLNGIVTDPSGAVISGSKTAKISF